MHCTCSRSHFTPRRWNSPDGRTTFRMNQHGMTDMSPGPNHDFFKWLYSTEQDCTTEISKKD